MSREVQTGLQSGPRTIAGGYLFGVPVGDLGWFATLLTSFASGFLAFFFATFCAILALLVLNGAGHKLDYALTYRRVGLPIGIVVGVLVLGYLGTLWVRRQIRRA